MLAAIRKLFSTGTRLPDELRTRLESDGTIFVADRVSVVMRFSGSVPGLHSGYSISRSAGALAFTPQRAMATLAARSNPSQHLIDCRWDAPSAGPMRVEISASGVQVDLDIARVDPRFNGNLALHYKTTLTDDVLAQLPRTSLRLGITADDVRRTLGVRPKK